MLPNCVIKFLEKNPKLVYMLRRFLRDFSILNVKKPRNLSDKIIQMSLLNTSEEWSILADKYAVREVVKERIGEQYLVPLYGVYDKVEDIDYDKLPNSFVLKTNNGCATNIIVTDKSNLDLTEVNQKLNKWLKYPYGALTGQIHYSKIKPRVIAEKLLEQKGEESLIDYKFYCVDGEPLCLNVAKNRKQNSHKFKLMFFDINWNEILEYVSEADGFELIKDMPKPESFDLMVELVRKLARGYKFVRIDLYEIDGHPYFGEYTFTPGIMDGCYSPIFREDIFNALK